jgi:hypothetical protein
MAEDGEDLVSSKYENLKLELSFAIRADSVANLDAAIRDLSAQITQKNWLEYQPESGSSLFYRTFPYDAGEPGTLQRKLFRLGKFAWGVSFELTAEPFARGPKESLTLYENLVPNWQFTRRTAHDFEDWVETSDQGSVTAVTATYYAFLIAPTNAGCSAKLDVTNAAGYAQITSGDYITVDNTKHYCLDVGYAGAGTGLDIKVEEYNDASSLLNTMVITPTAPAAGFDLSQTVLHPEDETGETYHFDSDTAKVKITCRVDGAVETWYILAVSLGMTEYLSGNLSRNGGGFVIPSDDLLGDVPSPIDLYLKGRGDDAEDTCTVSDGLRLYIGQAKEFLPDFDPVVECEDLGGVAANEVHAVGGDCRFDDRMPNLHPNPEFEEVSGSGNSSVWTGLTATRPGNTLLEDWTGDAHAGKHCVHIGATGSPADSIELVTTNKWPAGPPFITPGDQFDIEFWYRTDFEGTMNALSLNVDWYSSAPAYLSSGYANATKGSLAWKRVTATVTAPASTVQMKINLKMLPYEDKNVWVGGARVVSNPWKDKMFVGGVTLDKFKGKALPFFHMKGDSLAADFDAEVFLKGRLLDADGNEISTQDYLEQIAWHFQDSYFDWNESLAKFKPITIPTSGVSDNADFSVIEQELEIAVNEDLVEGEDIYSDCIVLVPVDGAFAEIHAGIVYYAIIDGRSESLRVLASLDGTLDEAADIAGGFYEVSKPFKFDPINGTNLVVLEVYRGKEYSGWITYDVFAEYNPLYLVVK